jgi:DNA-directed RNA polymerase subunit RPC12/RpoP
MQTGVVRSSYSESRSGGKIDAGFSQTTVREALRTLETVGAIRKEGEPNRDGTLYKVLLPEEIKSCRFLMQQREASDAQNGEKLEAEVDFYNIRENRVKIYERDNYVCQHCGKQLTRFSATLDHLQPVSEGGRNNYDNLVTACRECNSRKSAKTIGDFIADVHPTV